MTKLPAFFLTVAILHAQESARDWINRGVAEFKNARYPEARAAFERAIALEPRNVTALLYAASASMTQWVPGAESPENVAHAAQAEAGFRKVLDVDPAHRVAMASLASLFFNRAQPMRQGAERAALLDQAEEWYRKLLAVAPNDKVAHYSLGVIAWSRFYPALMAGRTKLGMRPETPGPLNDPQVRRDLEAQYGQVVRDGIASLRRAIDLDSEYDDAMAYLNLLVRERADLANTKEEYEAGVREADELVQRVLQIKKAKAERAAKQ